MTTSQTHDAIVVGAGPNGLAAAVTLARAGKSVIVYEASEWIGGGTRSAELTLPGFVHDICAAIHPLGIGSPFLRSLPLGEFGLEWIQPAAPLAHPLDDGTAVVLERSLPATMEQLGRDGAMYRRLVAPLVQDWSKLERMILAPLVRVPRHPFALARFGLPALVSGRLLAERLFAGERARALFGGMAAHSLLPLEHSPTASLALVMAILAHTVGWPLARGGSQNIANALAGYLRALGGEIVTAQRVESADDLPAAPARLFEVAPRALLRLAGTHFPAHYRRRLERFRYAPGAFKVDWALDAPMPWRARECLRAGTVHLGGTLAEIAASERAVWRGEPPEKPFIILAQQSLFDPSRAPAGKHTVWAYCHVPNGSTFDMTARMEAQIERFAPGFRDRILGRSVMPPGSLERISPNYVGGDINGGMLDLWQIFVRPTMFVPYTTPAKGIYLCSSSTPPGGGIHGMCGYLAAQAALKG